MRAGPAASLPVPWVCDATRRLWLGHDAEAVPSGVSPIVSDDGLAFRDVRYSLRQVRAAGQPRRGPPGGHRARLAILHRQGSAAGWELNADRSGTQRHVLSRTFHAESYASGTGRQGRRGRANRGTGQRNAARFRLPIRDLRRPRPIGPGPAAPPSRPDPRRRPGRSGRVRSAATSIARAIGSLRPPDREEPGLAAPGPGHGERNGVRDRAARGS